ncbi:MAG: hypothetical protein IKC21_03755 [Ruminococcus sp.]|nr:hypothetical protein [Ruminococcus sp.]
MKRILATVTAFMCIISLCSCSGDKTTDNNTNSRVSTAPIDPEIIGTWMNELSGYRFGENRKVSLIIDFSENAHFTENGQMQTMNALIPKENMDYDGKRVYVTNTAYNEDYQEDVTSVLIDMERLDEPNPDSLDGYYHIYGGVATDVLAEQLGIPPEKFDFEGKVEGDKFIIYMVDCFDYETVDGKVDMFGELIAAYIKGNYEAMSYDYTIEYDSLKMTMNDIEGAAPEVYFKADENK